MFLYDLSKGAAKLETPDLLGRSLEGVWHAGVAVYGREYSFTAKGVVSVIQVSSVLCLERALSFKRSSDTKSWQNVL